MNQEQVEAIFSLRTDNPRYFPREKVSGWIRVDVSAQKIPIESLRLEFHSREERNHHSFYRSRVNIIEKEGNIKYLAKGSHTFAFQLLLPENIPPTLKTANEAVDVRHVLSPVVETSTEIKSASLQIVVMPNVTKFPFSTSIDFEDEKRFGCCQGTFRWKLSNPKKAFSRGETFSLRLNSRNRSSRTLRVVLQMAYQTDVRDQSFVDFVSEEKSREIEAKNALDVNVDFRVPVEVPVSLAGKFSPVLDVNYFISVKVCVK